MAERQYIGARYVPVFASPVEWDNVRAYEPLTIVTHLGNSYTSKIPVPSGVDIGNTDYWVNTGNFNSQLEAISTSLESGFKHFNNSVKYVYIDGLNGSDDNSGTENSPFKTLDRFFNMANSIPGSLDIRCVILTAGVYNINWETLNGVSCHIVGQVDGIVLRSTSSKYFTVYGGHLNVKNVTIESYVSLQIENVTSAFYDVTFKCPVGQSGGALILERCSAPSLTLSYGTTIIRDGFTITNTDVNVKPISCNCHTLYTYGTMTFTALPTKSSSNILYFRRTNATLTATLTNEVNTNYAGIFGNNTQILSTKSILNKYNSVSEAITLQGVSPVFTAEGVAINSIPV